VCLGTTPPLVAQAVLLLPHHEMIHRRIIQAPIGAQKTNHVNPNAISLLNAFICWFLLHVNHCFWDRVVQLSKHLGLSSPSDLRFFKTEEIVTIIAAHDTGEGKGLCEVLGMLCWNGWKGLLEWMEWFVGMARICLRDGWKAAAPAGRDCKT
jgi:hypothetical protein